MKSFLAAAVALTSLCAAQAPNLASCDLCGDFEVGLHALAFVPMICEYDYATINADGVQPVASAECQLDWGFRLFGRYLSDCSFASLSYQWYESTITNSVGAPFNFFRGEFAGVRGMAQLHLEYQNVDVQIGSYLHRRPGCRFFVFGNIRWIDIHYRRTVRSLDAAGLRQILNEKSDFEGAALGIGGGTELDLPCEFGLFSTLNLLGVFARRGTTDTITANTVNRTPIDYQTENCISPEMAWRLGLSYTKACGWLELRAEAGYELDYFWNAIAFPSGQTVGRRLPDDRYRRCEDVGFSGLFFGLRFSF